MGRAPCCDKTKVKRGPWSSDEDAKLKSYIQEHGTGGNWITLPQKIGLKRCGKSCRLRWLNYLRPNIKHGGFSDEEDNIICALYMTIGSRWSIIAAQLPGRTDNDIKNYWNTKLKKKLIGKHRKEEQLEAARRSNTTSTNFNNANNNTIKSESYSIPDQAITHDQYYWPQHCQQLPIYSPEALSQQQDDGIINTTISNLSDDTILTIPLGEQVYANYYTNIMSNSQLLLNAHDIQDLDSFLINGDETREYDPMANAVPCGVDMVNSSCSTINSMNNNSTPTESTSSWGGDMHYSFRCSTISSYENSYNTHDGMRAFEDQQGYLGFQW